MKKKLSGVLRPNILRTLPCSMVSLFSFPKMSHILSGAKMQYTFPFRRLKITGLSFKCMNCVVCELYLTKTSLKKLLQIKFTRKNYSLEQITLNKSITHLQQISDLEMYYEQRMNVISPGTKKLSNDKCSEKKLSTLSTRKKNLPSKSF